MPKQIRVLIVEDSASDTELMLRELDRAGCGSVSKRVETAGEMTAALGGEAWDVVLCDYHLPNFNATQALHLLKATKLDLPFIVVTGVLGDEAAAGIMREGATDYVLKENLKRLPIVVEHAVKEALERRKHAQAELMQRESEERYRLLVERSPDAIIIHQNQKIIYANPSTVRLMGATNVEQLLGKQVLEVVHPDFREVARQRMELSLKNITSPMMEQKIIRMDGSIADVEVVGIPFTIDGKPAVQVILHDITERKRAENALRESEERFRMLVEGATDYSLLLLDAAGRIISWNASAERIHGYREDEIVGKDFSCLYNIDDIHAGEPEKLLRRANDKGRAEREGWHVRKDGSHFWANTILSALHNVDGKLRGFVQVTRDITERKDVEETLRRNEEVFRLLFSNNPLPMWVYDRVTLRLLEVNEAAVMHYGYSREEFLELTVRDIRPAEDVPELLDYIRKEGQGLRPAREWRHRKKSGEVINVLTSSHSLDFAGRPAVLVVTQDVTDRKRAEKRIAALQHATLALAESSTLEEAAEKILHHICENLEWDFGEFWIVDKAAGILRLSVNWHLPDPSLDEFEIAGEKLTFPMGVGLAGRVWSSRQPLWVPNILGDKNISRSVIAAKAGLHSSFSFPILQKNEVIGVMEFFSRETRLQDNDVIQLFENIGNQVVQYNERKQLEEQFRQSQKMEAVGQLAGGVAHDFNNILTVISGHTHLLLMEESFNAETRNSLNQISTAASRAANLTRQLLAFSRKQMMQPKLLDLNTVIENLTQMLRRIIGEDISLQYAPGAGLQFIEGDASMIEQVLLNLVVNARDAMPRGGKLFIETEMISLGGFELRSRPNARAGEFVCLRVRDTGFGIAPEILSHIFEPFFTTKEVGKGTGLGLATVYGIINQHHGWIEVESQPKAGTTFQIFLPAVSTPASDGEAKPVRSEIQGGNETVLIVEDETAVRELARRILEQHGYKIHEAESGAAALKAWKDRVADIDLLLTDLVMPDGVSGRELAEQLRNINPGLKIVFTSGYSTDAFKTNFFVREKRNFLQKPYDADSLLKIVREGLDKPAS